MSLVTWIGIVFGIDRNKCWNGRLYRVTFGPYNLLGFCPKDLFKIATLLSAAPTLPLEHWGESEWVGSPWSYCCWVFPGVIAMTNGRNWDVRWPLSKTDSLLSPKREGNPTKAEWQSDRGEVFRIERQRGAEVPVTQEKGQPQFTEHISPSKASSNNMW